MGGLCFCKCRLHSAPFGTLRCDTNRMVLFCGSVDAARNTAPLHREDAEPEPVCSVEVANAVASYVHQVRAGLQACL